MPDSRPEPEAPEPLDCDSALRLVRQFVAGEEDVAQRMRLRAHLSSCGECRDQYRSEVVLLSRLAHGPQRPLESLQKLEERARRSLGSRGPRLRVPLVRLLLPAIGLCALWAIAGPGLGGPAAQLECLAGEVHAGQVVLAPEGPPAQLARGNVCSSGPGARARLTCGDTTLVLGPATALVFERSQPLRVRLFGGQLEVEGAAVVTSAAGVVEIPGGAGTIGLDGATLTAEAAGEGWLLSDPSGVRSLPAGERRSATIGVLRPRPESR